MGTSSAGGVSGSGHFFVFAARFAFGFALTLSPAVLAEADEFRFMIPVDTYNRDLGAEC